MRHLDSVSASFPETLPRLLVILISNNVVAAQFVISPILYKMNEIEPIAKY